MVRDLMIPGCREWGYELLEELFCDEDVKFISSIPLSTCSGQDRRIWYFSPDERYTVKSSYRLTMELLAPDDLLRVHGDWSSLWSLKVPPKVRNFCWRACRNCLPTRINLQAQGLAVLSCCVQCSVGLEQPWHVFITCSFAQDCWRVANLSVAVESCMDEVDSFHEWFFKMLATLQGFNVSKFVMVLWAIWKQRNEQLWSNSGLSAEQVVYVGLEVLYAWLQAKEGNVRLDVTAGPLCTEVRWQKPPSSFVKCNLDAARFDGNTQLGLGMILCDDKGNFLCCQVCSVTGLFRVKEGEALALLEALKWVRHLGYQKDYFEMDAKTVTTALASSVQDLTEFGDILQSCKSVLAEENQFKVVWTRQEANKPAHALAKVAYDYVSPYCWLMVPSFLEHLVVADM
ncbi:hypothetical protein PTKIN_Ptkin09bG0145200 [Pterospermum kingtungense]